MCRHHYLDSLFIFRNQFTVTGLCRFLDLFKDNARSKLVTLSCDLCFKLDQRVIRVVHEINACRLLLSGLGHPRELLSILSYADYPQLIQQVCSLHVLSETEYK